MGIVSSTAYFRTIPFQKGFSHDQRRIAQHLQRAEQRSQRPPPRRRRAENGQAEEVSAAFFVARKTFVFQGKGDLP